MVALKTAKQLVLVIQVCIFLGSEAFNIGSNHASRSPLQRSLFHRQYDKLVDTRTQNYHSQMTRRELSASPIIESLTPLCRSIFRYSGQVPVSQSLGLNVVLFALLRSKLLRMLTPVGFVHACALGTGLWATLGWRGWTLCVAYLFLGSGVTKVRFAEKEKRGIAESRGGRRGPENIW